MRSAIQRLAVICFISLVAARATMADDNPGRRDPKQYYMDVTLFSLLPGAGLDEISTHGSGGVGPNGTLGLGVHRHGRRFQLSVQGIGRKGDFFAKVTVTPEKGDEKTEPLVKELDFSNLEPQKVDLAKDEDGRVFRVSLFPRVIVHPRPKEFTKADLELEKWTFSSSSVILNDQDYLGRLSMGRSPIAWLDIPGLAVVEFSLLPLANAKPEGTLEDGAVAIHHGESSIHISDVRNGANGDVLSGGPYQVWVRWKEPSQTVEEYHDAWKKQLENIKERVQKGELEVPPGTIERMERQVKSDRIFQISSGIRGVRRGDLAQGDADDSIEGNVDIRIHPGPR
jgi:hypothetical protein